MKNTPSARYLFPVLASCSILASHAATLTIDGLEVRSNTTNNNENAFATSPASLDLNATEPATGSTTSFSTVTWNNLDLDGIGGNDDILTFDLNIDGGSNNVTWGGLGFGASGALGAGETITFTVSNVSVSGGAAGSIIATFDGFTRGGYISYGSDIDRVGSVDINGETVSVNAMSTGTAFQSEVNESSVFQLTDSVVFSNADMTSGAAQARRLDLQFNTETVPEPSVALLSALGLLALARRRR
ncbi:PEP-CTERM sorting domain-containing protein [Luteolibacter algae]|uniref:PEP-CTERM sorting domain-containing protein n=1 Tax=Luteolibacter algae TaxID=454151 RepID=A0ABW5D3Y0_9BACT